MPKTEAFDRHDVLSRAMAVFQKKGYSGSSMQDLVDAMGLNRSSIYNSFGDKHNLFKETLELYREIQQHQAHNWLVKATNAREAISLLFHGIQEEIIADKEQMGCFVTNSTSEFGNSDGDFYPLLTKNQRDMEAMFADLIKAGQEDGSISKELDPATAGAYLFTSLQGLRMSGILRPERHYLDPVIHHILSIL